MRCLAILHWAAKVLDYSTISIRVLSAWVTYQDYIDLNELAEGLDF